MIFHPYLLKEYRNRWFLFGANKKNLLLTLALDRIISIKEAEKEKFIKNTEIDLETYYDDIIGVSKVLNQRPHLVVMKINKQNAPYVLTKPLHPSQKILKEEADGIIFSILVLWNFELEREILGFGEAIRVLSPKRIKNKIISRLRMAFENYKKPNEED